MNEKNLLIQCGSNYSDEFDVDCFQVMTESEWESHKKAAAKRFNSRKPDYKGRYKEVECGFGTNEAIYWHSLEEYLDSCKVTELSEQDYQTMKKCFGNQNSHRLSFGMDSIMIEDYGDEEDEVGDE